MRHPWLCSYCEINSCGWLFPTAGNSLGARKESQFQLQGGWLPAVAARVLTCTILRLAALLRVSVTGSYMEATSSL